MAKHFKAEKRIGCFGMLVRLIGTLLLIVILLVAGLIGFLSVTEFKPDDVMTSEVSGEASEELSAGDTFRIMAWNIGYGALGDNADFFMDGGTGVKTADAERLSSNMDGIKAAIKSIDPDILFVQEIDRDSARSEHNDQYAALQSEFGEYCSSFANNFKVAFLPYPVPPIGKVDSGIATFSEYPIAASERVQLPIPFKWPIRMANLKRCVLMSRVPLEGTDKELILMNLHLEAYDSGEGKVAQTKALAELLKTEADKGNYVIAGGDFNQIFSSADDGTYPVTEGLWAPGRIEVSDFGDGWQFLMDSSSPSCRSLDRPLEGADKENFQYYLIDGFIVSDNIKVKSLETKDLGFEVADHNPVLLELKLVK